MSYISQYTGQEIDNAIANSASKEYVNQQIANLQNIVNQLNTNLTNSNNSLQTQINNKTDINSVYPIGSIYISLESTSPASLFGGTWEKIQDKFLMGSGSAAAGTTGGTSSHTHTSAAHSHTTQGHVLTTDEMPNHYHQQAQAANSGSPSMLWGQGNVITTSPNFKSGTSPEYYFTSDISANWASEGNEYFLLTDSVGGDASHSHGDTGSSSNFPPYITVNIWKRTA